MCRKDSKIKCSTRAIKCASNQTIDAFGNIDVSIKKSLMKFKYFKRCINQINKQAILSIEEIAAITEESAASTKVLASVETQSSS